MPRFEICSWKCRFLCSLGASGMPLRFRRLQSGTLRGAAREGFWNGRCRVGRCPWPCCTPSPAHAWIWGILARRRGRRRPGADAAIPGVIPAGGGIRPGCSCHCGLHIHSPRPLPQPCRCWSLPPCPFSASCPCCFPGGWFAEVSSCCSCSWS